FRIANAVEGQQFLGQCFVFLNVNLAGSAAGVGQVEQIEQARQPDRSQLRVSERLHEIENEVRFAPRQASPQLEQVAMHAKDGDLVSGSSEGVGHLIDGEVMGLGVFRFQVRQN